MVVVCRCLGQSHTWDSPTVQSPTNNFPYGYLVESLFKSPEGESYNIKISTRVSILQSVDPGRHLHILRQNARCRHFHTGQADSRAGPGGNIDIFAYPAWGEGVDLHLGNTDKVSTSQAVRQPGRAGRKYNQNINISAWPAWEEGGFASWRYKLNIDICLARLWGGAELLFWSHQWENSL